MLSTQEPINIQTYILSVVFTFSNLYLLLLYMLIFMIHSI